VPIVEINGVAYTQSNVMHRYFGKLAGLYQYDPCQVFLYDKVLGIMENAVYALSRTLSLLGTDQVADTLMSHFNQGRSSAVR